jgi:tRNA (adenine57-N1/adenine58-N1)-methyltransferase
MNRRAVIQTLDSCQQHSRHAEKVVQNFRHGMYYGDIDFHVGSINNYLVERLQVSSNEPFLDHAILDLPSTEDYFDIIGCAMKPGGTLLTFCPSITQITEGVLKVRGADLPFWLERVVEVGGGVGVGGREWDVRPVKPRAALKAEQGILDETKTSPPALEDTSRREQHSIAGGMDSGWSMVCRPKVGRQVVGGGFVAVWRRMVELAV